MRVREASLKAAIVLVPSYAAAYLTGEMVWVVPTLAAASFFAGSISLDERSVSRRVDEDTDDADGVTAGSYDPGVVDVDSDG